jgi:hypothetical protein
MNDFLEELEELELQAGGVLAVSPETLALMEEAQKQDAAQVAPPQFIDFHELNDGYWLDEESIFAIFREDAPDIFAVNFENEEAAEEAYLKVAPLGSYLGIEEITSEAYADDEDGLRLDRTYVRDTNGRFARTAGSGSSMSTSTKKEKPAAPDRINTKTNIAQLKAIAEKHGIPTPKSPHKRESWKTAINDHPEGRQYFEKKPRKAATSKKTEPETKKSGGIDKILDDGIKDFKANEAAYKGSGVIDRLKAISTALKADKPSLETVSPGMLNDLALSTKATTPFGKASDAGISAFYSKLSSQQKDEVALNLGSKHLLDDESKLGDQTKEVSKDLKVRTAKIQDEVNALYSKADKLSDEGKDDEAEQIYETLNKKYSKFSDTGQPAVKKAPVKTVFTSSGNAKKVDKDLDSWDEAHGDMARFADHAQLVERLKNLQENPVTNAKYIPDMERYVKQSAASLPKNSPYGDPAILQRVAENYGIGFSLANSKGGTKLGVYDEKGNLQAAASYSIRKQRDRYTLAEPHIYIEYLATAPWNVAKTDKTVKGAGTDAIVQTIELSKKKGFGGRIRLSPIEGAEPFYEKLGFKPDRTGSTTWELSPSEAEKLLKKVRG